MALKSTERALGIPEILSDIIYKAHECDSNTCKLNLIVFYPRVPGKDCKHTEILRKCILVSRSWAGVAIPQLWGNFASIDGLAGLLGYGHSPQSKEEESDCGGPSCNEPLTASLLSVSNIAVAQIFCYQNGPLCLTASRDRWNFYAPLVQKLHIAKREYTFEVLSCVGRGRSLLPNLKILYLQNLWDERHLAHPTVQALLSLPNLQHLRIKSDYEEFACLLHVICNEAPNLLSLGSYAYIWRSTDKQQKGLENLLRLKKLHSLQLPQLSMTENLLALLKRLPSLRRLNLFGRVIVERYLKQPVYPLLSLDPLCENSVNQEFPNLLTIYLQLPDPDLESLFTRGGMGKTRIQAATLVWECEEFKTHFTDLIADFCPDLKYLLLCPSEYDSPEIGSAALASFASCKHMTCLEVSGIRAGDGELRNILRSNSWSSIREFALIGRPMAKLMNKYPDVVTLSLEKEFAGPTLGILVDLSLCLPSLRILKITVVASPIEELPKPVRFRNLDSFSVVSSFRNYRYRGFDVREAARYTSEFFEVGTGIHECEDLNMSEVLRYKEHGRDYIAEYNECLGTYYDTLNSYLKSRS